MCPVESTAFPGLTPSCRCQVDTREMAPGWIFMDKAFLLHAIWIPGYLMQLMILSNKCSCVIQKAHA